VLIFESESDLLQTIDEHDALVRQCVNGEISFCDFCEKYNDFYARCALDGHESDDEERLSLDKHINRIEPHRVIAHEILGQVCSDEDAELRAYKLAGRFGSAEALSRLRQVKFSI
jgi:hypothetical protein